MPGKQDTLVEGLKGKVVELLFFFKRKKKTKKKDRCFEIISIPQQSHLQKHGDGVCKKRGHETFFFLLSSLRKSRQGKRDANKTLSMN